MKIPFVSFDEDWSYVANRIVHLKEFCGGLARPGMSSVESNFPNVNLEKDD
jgi:hypothetical protein